MNSTQFIIFSMKQVVSMYNITTIAPSLSINDFLAAFDLDKVNIKSIDIYHEDSPLNIYLKN